MTLRETFPHLHLHGSVQTRGTPGRPHLHSHGSAGQQDDRLLQQRESAKGPQADLDEGSTKSRLLGERHPVPPEQAAVVQSQHPDSDGSTETERLR